MYGSAANSVTSWNYFVRLFLRKYFPNAKAIKLRNEIIEFVTTISRILAGNHNKILALLPGMPLLNLIALIRSLVVRVVFGFFRFNFGVVIFIKSLFRFRNFL